MKTFSNNSLIKVNVENYLKLLIILVPALNFLPGFTVDLYTPSMPGLANYYLTSAAVVKNTVTATLIGFAIGGFINGIFIDVFGRRRIILLGLFFYIFASVIAVFCHVIEQLILIRFIQGFLASAFTIGCRAIVIDNFKGHQFNVAMLYTSLAYGIGPIIGPFIGGILQHHFGWKANFIAYGVMGFVYLLLFSLFVNESMSARNSFSMNRLLKNYKGLLTHRVFVAAIFLTGLCQIQMMLYSTVGAFMVENILHRTAIVYGNTALLIGLCYFSGTLTNRFLIRKLHVLQLTKIGLIILIIGSVVQILLGLFGIFNLFNLVLPIMIICFGIGFIFANLSVRCLKLFPEYAGIATSVLISFGLAISSVGIFLISFIEVDDLMRMASIFAAIIILQLIVFYGFFKKDDLGGVRFTTSK